MLAILPYFVFVLLALAKELGIRGLCWIARTMTQGMKAIIAKLNTTIATINPIVMITVHLIGKITNQYQKPFLDFGVRHADGTTPPKIPVAILVELFTMPLFYHTGGF